jgi:hypothetical protein
MSNAPEPLPAHLRPVSVGIPVTWTPEQAFAVYELLDDLRERIWNSITSNCRICSASNSNLPTRTTATTHCPPLSQHHSSDRPPPVAGTVPGNGSPTNNPVVRSRRPSRRPDLRSPQLAAHSGAQACP